MLVAYEGAILILGPDAVHNGAAVWLQNALRAIGLGQYVLLPVLTCGALLGWHYLLRQPFAFTPWVLVGMLVEALLWAGLLWAVYQGYCRLLGVRHGMSFDIAEFFGFFGAGIYEELVFRVMLLAGVAAIVRAAGAESRASLITGILVSAALFAAAHYNLFVTGGTSFSWVNLVFHFLCGVYLGALFALRGFGITAGAHAFYNVAVVLLAL